MAGERRQDAADGQPLFGALDVVMITLVVVTVIAFEIGFAFYSRPLARGAAATSTTASSTWPLPSSDVSTTGVLRAHLLRHKLMSSSTDSNVLVHSTITITLDRCGHLKPGAEADGAAKLDRYLDAASG